MDKTILQYQISDVSQLSKCKSNNCPELRINVSDYIQNSDIEGTKVSVVHPIYGTLFAYVINPRGLLVTRIDRCETDIIRGSTLLNELKRYGFYISYEPECSLPMSQVNLLKTLQGLHYDKLRLIVVYEDSDPDISENYVTAFTIKNHPDWINSGYSIPRREWEQALIDGSAFNVSGLDYADKFNWDWVYNSIIDIDQIVSRYPDE